MRLFLIIAIVAPLDENAALPGQRAAGLENDAALSAQRAAGLEKDAALAGQRAAGLEKDAALAGQRAAGPEKDAALAGQRAAGPEKDAALPRQRAAPLEKGDDVEAAVPAAFCFLGQAFGTNASTKGSSDRFGASPFQKFAFSEGLVGNRNASMHRSRPNRWIWF